jgi:hypothetical protein
LRWRWRSGVQLRDNSGNKNIGELESFAIRDGPKPTANLANPTSSAQVDLKLLNARGFIDVTFAANEGALSQRFHSRFHSEFTLS